MKHIVIAALICGLAQVAQAESEETAPNLMERGAQLFLEGILKELGPALDDLEELGPQFRNFMDEMGPALAEIFNDVKDWSVYEAPEILPNGDIIIRRKTPKPSEDGSIDL